MLVQNTFNLERMQLTLKSKKCCILTLISSFQVKKKNYKLTQTHDKNGVRNILHIISFSVLR